MSIASWTKASVSAVFSKGSDFLTFEFDECESVEERSMEIFDSESDVVSSLVDRLTDTADAEVVVVKPVGPDIPLSLLDDAEIPDGSGM